MGLLSVVLLFGVTKKRSFVFWEVNIGTGCFIITATCFFSSGYKNDFFLREDFRADIFLALC